MTTHHGSSRGASEIISYLLLLVIVIAGIALIVLHAGSAVDDFREANADQQVDDAFLNLQSTIANVALAPPGSREDFSLGLHGQPGVLLFDEDDGTVEVEIVEELSPGAYATDGVLLEEQPLRSLRYQEEERRVVYQGGGIFATDITTATDKVVSPPHVEFYPGLPPQCDASGDRPDYLIENCQQRIDDMEAEGIEYTNVDTLSLSVFTIDESSYIGDSLNVFQSDDETSTTVREVVSEDRRLRITIKSSYAELWVDYFESALGEDRVESASMNPEYAEIIISPGDSEMSVQITHTTIEFQ